jgi:hypothetical protein
MRNRENKENRLRDKTKVLHQDMGWLLHRRLKAMRGEGKEWIRNVALAGLCVLAWFTLYFHSGG